jgi:hypothetical protein
VTLGSSAIFSALRAWIRKPALRLTLFIVALLVFCVGCFYSFRHLAISPSDLHFGSLAILALLIAPSLLYGGVGLILLARSAGFSMPIGRATTIAAYAYLAELLPVPGGAIVRVGTLVNAGGTMRKSTTLVMLAAVLWMALAFIGAGVTLLWQSHYFAWPLLLMGVISTAGSIAWLWSIAGAAITAQTLVHRLVGLGLIGIRIKFAFAAFGTSIGFTESFPFVLAILLGSASSIAPAGLGVSEALASLMAVTGNFPPTVAFLATGTDRFLSLLGCGILILVVQVRSYRSRRIAPDP